MKRLEGTKDNDRACKPIDKLFTITGNATTITGDTGADP
jgi:hypothetical protein